MNFDRGASWIIIGIIGGFVVARFLVDCTAALP